MEENIKTEVNETSKIGKKNKFNIILFLLTPVIITGLMILTLNYTTDIWYYLKPKVIIFVVLFLEIIHVFLTAITGSSKRSTIIQGILLWILELINTLRYTYTYEPVKFSDFVYSSNATEIFSIVKDSIAETLWNLVPVFSCLAVILTFLIYLVHKFNFKFKKNTRIITGSSTLIILIILFAPIQAIKKFMLTYIYDIYSTNDYEHNSSNMQYYSEDSLFGGMYLELLQSRISKPENYNIDELKKILKNTPNETENIWEKSNIIVTFSESFFDVDLLKDDVKFNIPVTSNFNKLKDKGIFVNMISPSYGGISANVEFEFLTGYSLNYFGKGYTPFMQLYNSNSYSDRLSLIKELNNNGYYTKVVFGKDFFKSEKVYERLGIDKYEQKDIKSEYKGYYTSDEYLISEAIDALENKKPDEKLFYMNCTIESHMPFIIEKYKNYDVQATSSTLTKSQTEVIQSYAQSCYNADKELGRLYDYIQTFDEPTIIIFYGDHLPYLTDTETKKDLINSLSYFNTDNNLLNSYRKYNTQALVLANFDLGENTDMSYLSPDMLLTTVVNKMGLDLSSYYRWLYSTKDSLPCTNYLVTADSKGKLFWTNDIEGEAKETSDLREKMQYMVLIDGEKE